MSHYAVMVIGENIEEQLAPFDENMEVEEYTTGPLSDEEKARCVNYYVKKYKGLAGRSFGEIYALHGEDWNSNRYRQDEDGVWRTYTTYNPQSKWDWYVLGGRFSGYLKAKEGATEVVVGQPGAFNNEVGADQMRKRDIDIKAMRQEAREEAEKSWDAYHAAVKDHPKPEKWGDVLARFGHQDNIELARKFYHSQPAIQAMRKAYIGLDPEYYGDDRQAFVDRRVMAAGVPFALLMNGEWYENGKMGWRGAVQDEKDPNRWYEEFHKLFDALPDDTLVSIVDCYI